MNDKQIYDLLISIDNGLKPAERALRELSSVRHVRWRDIEYLPRCMNLLTGLRELDLCDTDVHNISALSGLTSLLKLNLSSTAVSDIRPLAGLSSLKELALTETHVKDISPLASLTSLSTLKLRRTAVRDISPLAALSSLSWLDLNNTFTGDISPLSGLSALSRLDLSDTDVQDLRPLAGLSSLRELYLRNTAVKDLSPAANIKDLTLLDLRHSEAPFIPESFLSLGLDFVAADSYPSGTGILIHDLRLTEQDITVFSQPRDLIQEYYRSLDKEDRLPVNKCKVVFLGDGGAGKSLIIDRLLRDDFLSPDFSGETTPGINISSKTYPVGEDMVELSFWDFGGEAIMHSMHRLFLTSRTLYVIVTNARGNNANEQAWYWLQNIKSFAVGAPVFLLVNHRDENPFVDINGNGLRSEYPGLRGFRIVSALKDSADEIRANILDPILKIVQSMESVHTPFPRSWLSLMNGLQGMEKERITSAEFYTKCRENNIEIDDQVLDRLISWYQDLGVCFYSRKHRSSGKYMVLKPKWLLNALYILIFNGRKYAENGIIVEDKIYELIGEEVPEENVRKVYPDITYKEDDDITYIINVLVNFNLVRRLDNDRIFIPMLCDENEAEDIKGFVSEDALHFSFDYAYLPENVLYRLMIQQWHQLNLKKVWKSGAVFEQKDLGWKALARIRGSCLEIYAESSDRDRHPAAAYMDLLCEAVRRINNDLGLTAEEYISFREKDREDRFRRDILEESRNAGLPRIYSGVFKRILKIDDILGKTVRTKDRMTEDVIDQMLSALSEMSEQTVFKADDFETELTADFQGRISAVLNQKYGIQTAREYTMGRAGKTIGETDLYFFREENGIKEQLYILENKIIKNFREQYEQLAGYLNPNFRAGMTLSINKTMEWEEAFDFICEKLEELRKEGGRFAPTLITRKDAESGTLYIRSEHIVPETGRSMPVYHLVMQLSDIHRQDIAKKARKKAVSSKKA